DAFDHHAISESNPEPATTPACVVADPRITLTSEIDAATGRPAIRVAWYNIGAAGYHVLRADGDGEAYLLLAPPFGSGAGEILDRGVMPGRTYLYRILAQDPMGCLSPGATPARISPGAFLRITS